jgi:hypothetical protein
MSSHLGGGYHIIFKRQAIFRLAETREGKKIFLQPKNFLLMRYNVDFLSNSSERCERDAQNQHRV